MNLTAEQQLDAVRAKRSEVFEKYIHCGRPEMESGRMRRLGKAHDRLWKFVAEVLWPQLYGHTL